MKADSQRLLAAYFPGQQDRYFAPMSIGNTAASAEAGAALILSGVKTTTSSVHWDYADGRIPFVGALSVLLDGTARARGIVETERVKIMPFGKVDEDFVYAYGEGDRTLAWWHVEVRAWYQEAAQQLGLSFTDSTPIICEWFRVIFRL